MVPKYAESPIEFFPGSRKAIPGGIKLLRVNTTHFKGRLARKLGVKSGDPGAMYFYAIGPAADRPRVGSLIEQNFHYGRGHDS